MHHPSDSSRRTRMQLIPKRFQPKPAQLVGFGLWAPVALGGLFYMIGDPGAHAATALVRHVLSCTRPVRHS